MKKDNIRRFSDYDRDFIKSRRQDFPLPDDYEYIKTDPRSKFLSALSYALALAFYCVYCKIVLHVKIKNAKELRRTGGCFVYANHTQPLGDVFDPAAACLPHRIYTIVSPSNLGIPFIGRVLPYLGALPLPASAAAFRRFTNAVGTRINEGKNVVIYPEAHVWEYCAEIRPFTSSAFKYPVMFDRPAFCLTTTYRRRRFGRPAAIIYADGPFYPNGSLPRSKRAEDLKERISQKMIERSRQSDCEYIKYVKIEKAEKEKITVK